MDPMLGEFRAVAEGLSFARPRIPLVSNVTGELADPGLVAAPGYWVGHVRAAVRFADGVRALRRAGAATFFELGPDAVLSALGAECLDDGAGAFVPSLRRDADDVAALAAAAARLHVRGVSVDWSALVGRGAGWPVDLPTYAFQRQRYWLEEAEAATPTTTEADDVDARFWDAVEREDLASLAETLEIDAENGQKSLDAMNAAIGVLASWRRGRSERSMIDRLRYKVLWTPIPQAVTGVPTGSWLVVVPHGLAEDDRITRFAHALDGQSLPTRLLEFGENEGAGFVETVREILADDEKLAGVLSLLALDERARPESAALTEGAAATLALMRTLGEIAAGLPVWCATSGAVTVGPGDRLRAPEQALVWGLGHTVALEHPDRWGGLVDLPEVVDDRAVQSLLGVLTGSGGEDQVAVRSAGVFARRVLDGPLRDEPLRRDWTPRGTVLVTGGTEGLGRHVATWLAEAGAEHLLLTVDSAPDAPHVRGLVDELAELGAEATVSAVDLSRRDEVAELLAGPAEARAPLTAVVHAADLARIMPVGATGLDDLSEVLSVKADAALHLDELLGDRPLDMFVVFSSVAGVWGGGGQGAAGAASAFLDALVERRRARGLRATSLAWGVIDEMGVAADPAVQEQLRRRGVLPIAPESAVAVLSAAVRHDDAVVAVADIEWSAFVPAFTSSRPSPLLGDLPAVKRVVEAAVPSADEEEAGSQLVRSLAIASEADQKRILMKLVRERSAEALGHTGLEEVKPQRAFQEIGFDSLAAVALRNDLAAAVGVRLPATLIFDYPTPEALVEYLRGELVGNADGEVEGDEDEEDVRRVLASVPLSRFREAGVLDTLLSLVRSEAAVSESGPAPTADDVLDLIDAMDVADLVQRALGGTQS